MYDEDYSEPLDWLDELYENAAAYGRHKAVQMSPSYRQASEELYGELYED